MEFDWQQYILNYPDLHFIKNETEALKHYNKYGKNEERSFLKLK